LSIREFKSSDLPAIKAFVDQTIDVCYVGVYPREAVQFFKDWHSNDRILADAEEEYTVVLEQDGQVIGTGTVVGNEIKRVFVGPVFQKRGLGRLIMRALEEHAISTGIDVVKLDASLPSKKFYDSLGYVILEETFLEVENNKRLDYYRMEKRPTDK
jgi:GNAT superfamily N-acetyltransferase